MRPTFFGFETAKRGLMVNQKGLDITGHNLTNVSTKGYTRQRMDLVSLSMDGSTGRYPVNKNMYAGMGVDIGGVSQVRDSFLDKRFREEYGNFGYFDQSAAIMTDVGNALDEIGGTGLQNSLNKLSDALSTFSGNPSQVTHANIVLTATKNLMLSLNQYSNKLDSVSSQQRFDLGVSVDSANSILSRIGAINKTIADEIYTSNEYSTGAYGPNELLDQRNMLLDELSRFGDMVATPQSDGSVTVTLNGKTVVEGHKYDQIMASEDVQTKNVELKWQSSGETVTTPNGTLKAFVDMINGQGPTAAGRNQNFTKGIPYFKERLDMIANHLAEAFNSTIPGCDITDSHDPHDPTMFREMLTGSADGVDGRITAATIQISDDWINNPGFIIPPSCVTGPTGGGANNGHIISLKDKLERESQFGEYKGSVSGFVNYYNTTIGQENSFYQSRLKTVTAVSESLLDSRDAISGVSPDEEGANMMLYDKAYKALARLMTTMDEALDVIINKTGLVGR